MKYYKVLGKGRTASNGGSGKWPKPGIWFEVEGPLVPCQTGLHLCQFKDLVVWLDEKIWVAEPAPGTETIVCDDKVVVRKARLIKKLDAWNEKTARLFAADCAERVLPIYEERFPGEDRPRKAIEAARKYADKKITKKMLAAARDAAWGAAWDVASAARGAASAAERKWQTERLAYYLSINVAREGEKGGEDE